MVPKEQESANCEHSSQLAVNQGLQADHQRHPADVL